MKILKKINGKYRECTVAGEAEEDSIQKYRMVEFVNRLKNMLTPKEFDIYSKRIHGGWGFMAIGKLYRMDAYETRFVFNKLKPKLKKLWLQIEEELG